MAEIESLGDGKWKVRVFLGRDPRGRSVRRSKVIVARNRSQANQRANEWLGELQQSEWAREALSTGKRKHDPTVADAADAWYEACQLRDLTAGTLLGYARHRDAIKADIGHMRLDRLTARDIERYYAEVRRTGVRVKHRHRALRGILYEAMRLEWIGVNPARNTRRPAEHAKRGDPPTTDEIVRLIKAGYERSEETGNFVVVAVGTGMRRGEVAAMRASRVDWDAGVYVVDAALSNIWDDNNELIVKAPKTNQVRKLSLSDRVADAIMAQAELLERRARLAGAELVADPWLWSASADAGRPRPPQWFSKEFSACCSAAGVKARLHDLRHAAATIMLDLGVPLPTVSEYLGHANTYTTGAIYAHGVSSRAREAAELLGRAIGELGAGG
jgi:integrase